MPVRFVDYLQTRITNVGGIAADATSVGITPGDGAKILADIPGINSGDWLYGWFKDIAGHRECVKFTGRSTDTLTIGQRAVNSRYPARAWAQGDIIHFSLSRYALDDIVDVVMGKIATWDEINQVCDGNTSTAEELSQLAGQGAVAADFAKLHALTISSANLNKAVTTDGNQTLSGNNTLSGTNNFTGTLQLNGSAMPAAPSYTSFSPGGDFNSGTVHIAKYGRLVVMTWTSLDHSSNQEPVSAVGVIPAAYRPGVGASVLYHFTSQTVYRAMVSTEGTIFFQYRDWAGSALEKKPTEIGTMSWVSAS